ncbi:MAG TPA: DinB family protein [Gaiellales bacterium]|nr:DinB family protein [Gaiellales bacterium]
MDFSLATGIEVLARTPATLRAMLAGLPAAWISSSEGPDTWTPEDILGHLIQGEQTDWIPRARIILTHGESQPFEPFDQGGHKRQFAGWSLARLLDRFAELRTQGLETLRGWRLTREQLALRGTHPELGQVTLSQLLSTWVVHDLGHIGQIARVMAKQYTAAVGPWKAYLPVLTRY